MSVFSPLALTQALPFLPLAQGDIDYEVSRRDEPDLFDTALLEPDTKVILVKDGMVAVPRGQGAIADYANVHMRLAQLPGAYVAAELHTHPTALAIFLGSYGGKRDEHVVAVDVSRVKAAETVVASSEHMGADDAFGEQHEPEAKTSKSLLESAAERFDWVDLRGFAPHASARCLMVSRLSPPWPTSRDTATTSLPVRSFRYEMATEVSRPPEYARTRRF